MNYLNDFLEDLIGSQILKREKEEAEKEISRKIEKAKKSMACRQAIIKEEHFYSVPTPEAHIVGNFLLWYSEHIEKFVVEEIQFDDRKVGHFCQLNVLLIYDGFVVVENFRYEQWKSRYNSSKKRNYFVVWFEGNVLKWKAISRRLYREMRRDFLNEKNPIVRFQNWEKTGEEISTWKA